MDAVDVYFELRGGKRDGGAAAALSASAAGLAAAPYLAYASRGACAIATQHEIRPTAASRDADGGLYPSCAALDAGFSHVNHGESAPLNEAIDLNGIDLNGGPDSLGDGKGAVTSLFTSHTRIVRQEAPAAG